MGHAKIRRELNFYLDRVIMPKCLEVRTLLLGGEEIILYPTVILTGCDREGNGSTVCRTPQDLPGGELVRTLEEITDELRRQEALRAREGEG